MEILQVSGGRPFFGGRVTVWWASRSEREREEMPMTRPFTNSILVCLCLLALLMGCDRGADTVESRGDKAADAEQPAAGAVVDCGNPMTWDSDGDGVSDRIEDDNAGRFQRGRCDDDPSRPEGKYAAGALVGGVNLPNEGAGYMHAAVDTSPAGRGDWAVLDLLACIETVGRDLEGLTTVRIGDLSRESGGEFEPHISHQNGLEFEVRYPRKDGSEDLFDIRQQHSVYDPLLTHRLFTAFVRLCRVDAIFADVTMLSFPVEEGDSIINHPDRRTHFLVRLEPPAGASSSVAPR